MAKLCGRPGCSEPGAVSYGMVPEDLLFWVAPLDPYEADETGVLCRRHADAMRVPRGWTLDDRREPVPRLFRPPPPERSSPAANTRRRRPLAVEGVEQLELDGTQPEGIARPAELLEPTEPVEAIEPVEATEPFEAIEESTEQPAAWTPAFDVDDDLGGLLEVSSPLLARAFRGSARSRR